ncbi:cation:proton antiporter [Halapricum sp. CBA1109]|uniref:cation:proton antiporter n=1 Tax=Halapricum sp. CBA1109 TaxID=2668068 RepID=UPI0013B6BAB2|nr:cation:proton antiporter [Halapricum sp. CBA1109]
MASETALLEIGLLFAAVATVGAVARRVRQSVIPFYIAAGIALGPYVTGRLAPFSLTETEFVAVGAELGIVLLLLFLGLEFNLSRLAADRDRIGKAGTLDLFVNFGVGFALGYLLFGAVLPAFLVAGAVYISSSAIISKSLIDLGWIANDEAGPMLGILVYEDLVIAVYLVVASTLVLGGGDLESAAQSMAVAVGFILALLVLVAKGTPLFQRLLSTDSRESLVLRAVGITVPVAGLALYLGVSEAVAAFFVGMAVSSTDHVHDIEGLLEPLRDVFAAVFFFWIGLVTDPLLFVDVAGLILAAVVVTTPTKLLSGYLGGRVYGLDARRSTRVGLGMTTRGEFSLIIASLALSGAGTTLTGGVGETIYAFAVGYVLVMSVLGTTLMQFSGAVERVVVPRLERG